MSHAGLEPTSDRVRIEPETLSSASLESIPVENSFQPITSSGINGRMPESCKEHVHGASGKKDSRSPSPLSEESCDRKRRKSLILFIYEM